VVFIDHGGERDRHARERLAAAGYTTHAVLDIARITRVLRGAGRLSEAQAGELLGQGAAGTGAQARRPG